MQFGIQCMGCYTANKNKEIIKKTKKTLINKLPKEIIDIIIKYMPSTENQHKFACYCIDYEL